MKNLISIILRYAVSAVGVLIFLIFSNLIAVLIIGTTTIPQLTPLKYNVRQISQALTQDTTGWHMSKEFLEILRESYAWAMLIDENGEIVWSDRLPESLSHHYTPAQIASFTRWYLDDYPVYVYQKDDGILVLGNEIGSRWKYLMEMDRDTLGYLIQMFPVWAVINLILAACLILLSSIRFFCSLRRVAAGLSDLAHQQPVNIPEKGIFGSLYHDLNRTSAHLMRQQEILIRRDRMRTEWIAGVSHDVRTPLTLILGHAAQIESDTSANAQTQEKAQVIRVQCEHLRQLIEDLNLASKLTYGAQPIRETEFDAAVFMRHIAANFLNEYPDIDFVLEIDCTCEGVQVKGDCALLERAIRNILVNSVKHTTDSTITVQLVRHTTFLEFTISDTGDGYPASILENLHHPLAPELPTHGLGLSIVRQIVALHGGTTEFFNIDSGACTIITIPLPKA